MTEQFHVMYQVSQYHLWVVRHTHLPHRGRVLFWVFLQMSMKQSLCLLASTTYYNCHGLLLHAVCI